MYTIMVKNHEVESDLQNADHKFFSTEIFQCVDRKLCDEQA